MRPESGVLPPSHLAAAASPASTIEDDCYFTAKAVPIRASVALSGATSASHLSYYMHHSPATLGSGMTNNNNASPSPLLSPSPSPLLSPASARNSSALVTPAEFPPPPGHSHPSFVFRRSQAVASLSPAMNAVQARSPVVVPSPPVDGLRVNSTHSAMWDADSPGLGLGLSLPPPPPLSKTATTGTADSSNNSAPSRESVWPDYSPSLLPHPPSVNGKDAHIRPLFFVDGRQESTLSALSVSNTPGPTPPPKEYHPTLSPVSNDYFSPLAPMVTSVQPAPTPPRALQLQLQSQQQPPLPPQPTQKTTAGMSRHSKPLPLEIPGTMTSGARTGGAGNDALSPISHPPPTATSQTSLLSPISQHSPVSNPALSPLTASTLQHLSNTALRSPSLTFIDGETKKEKSGGQGLGLNRYGSTASRPLTGAQRDRLLQLKRDYDRRQGYGQGDEEKGGRWGVRSRSGRGSRSSLRFVLLALGLGLLALGGIVGLIVALTVAQKGQA